MKKTNLYLSIMVLFLVFILSCPEAAVAPVNICKAEEWEVLRLVNQERAKAGLFPLSISSELQKTSRIRAVEITKKFSHQRPNKKAWYTALSKNSTFYHVIGENIASGQTTPRQVNKEWMASPSHRENILGAQYTHIGIGHYRDKRKKRSYWSQFFLGSCSPKSIALKKKKVNTYLIHTSITAMNYTLVIKCKHGTSYVPVTDGMCTGYKKNRIGKQRIRINFRGKKISFTVQTKQEWIHKAKVMKMPKRFYNASLHKPRPVVKLNGITLKEGTDFQFTYKNNLYRGTGQIILKGCGKYKGKLMVPFKIY